MPFKPRLENPYPSPGWEKVDRFRFLSNMVLIRMASKDALSIPREAQYIVGEDYSVSIELDGETVFVTVPAGMLTDLASVPRIARGIVGRVGPHLEAAVVHDFLYRVWRDLPGVEPNADMHRFADSVMLAGMRAVGMETRAAIIYRSLRWFGSKAFFGDGMEPRYVNISDVR